MVPFPKRVGTVLEVKLARILDTSPAMIRFWAARLLVEINRGRRLTPEELKHVSSRAYASFPRVGTRYIIWPEE